MSNVQVIESFLVQLGYKIDEASRRRFEENMDKGVNLFTSMASAAAVAGVAIGVAVDKMAGNLESLFFASRRVGAGVANIEAFKYAVGQLGGTGQAAMASLENFAKFMREKGPGAESWLNTKVGVRTRNANGALRDTVEMYMEFAEALRQMDSSQAAVHAKVPGTDDQTLQAIRTGEIQKYMAEYQAELKASGLDLETGAKAAHDYEENMRRLAMQVDIVGKAMAVKLIPYMERLAELASELVQKHGKDLPEWLDANAGALEKAAVAAAIVVGPLWAIDKAASAVLLTIGRLTKILSILSGGGALGALARVLGVGATLAVHSEDLNQGEGDWVKKMHAMQDKGNPYAKPSGGTQDGSRARGIRNNNPGNIEYGDFAKRMGATGSDGRFAIFPTPEAGLRAMSELLGSYARRGINSARDIVNRWAPASENNVGAYSGALAKALGVSPDAVLNMRDPQTIANLMGAITTHENGSNPYGRDAMLAAAGGRGASTNIQMTVNINGAGDPRAVAHEVAGIQRSVLQDATRSAVGVTR
jgi:hypothetical protein